MPTYALLILPSANRVYADSAVALTRAELALMGETVLGGRVTGLAHRLIGGVSYLTFEAEALADADIAFLSNLSSIYALFELTDGALRPVELRKLDRFDDDLITIPKYQGKTNEQFTKLLVNATLLSSAFAADMTRTKLALLDPVCGRGTTLNQALMYGWDAAGIDVDGQDFEAYRAFIVTWCKRKRIKHHAATGQVRRDRHVVARRFGLTLAASRDDYKAGRTQRVEFINADTVRALEFFKAEEFHLLVADLPYGVQHGSRTAGKGLARSPLDLLASAVPVWSGLLKPGGALGISLNTFVAGREAAARLIGDHGLHVADSGPYRRFEHRVDQAINRDILVARKR